MALLQPIPPLIAVDVEIQHIERLQIALDVRRLLLGGRRGIPRARTPGGERRLGADLEDDIERETRIPRLHLRLQIFRRARAREGLIERRQVLLGERDARRRGPERRLLMA